MQMLGHLVISEKSITLRDPNTGLGSYLRYVLYCNVAVITRRLPLMCS
jgi:hypothetical protein